MASNFNEDSAIDMASNFNEDSAIDMASNFNEDSAIDMASITSSQSHRNTVSTNPQCENVFEQVFDRNEELGSGGQGTVYECTERSLCTYRYRESGGTFAVKIINTDRWTQEKIARLQTELQLLNQINGEAHVVSSQIVQVFHAYEVPKCTYILMERMLGGSLTRWCSRRESLPVSESDTRLICRSLFEALDYCHQRCIAHRDIKPCNLLLARPNDLSSLKIADFGCAKIVPQNGLRTTCGTLYFLPPELILRMRYDTKCDMWSAGVVLYKLLSGRLPFRNANNIEEYCKEVVLYDIDFDNFHGQQVSDEAKAFVSRLMTRKPRKRLSATEALGSPWMMIQA